MTDRERDSISSRLDELEARQRAELPAPDAPIRRVTSGVQIPEGGALPRSAEWLERLYAGDFVPREKKPQVVDTRRCAGPYLVTVDERPMVLLDACSQIATLTHGFAHPTVLQALYEGRFDDVLWSDIDNTVAPSLVLDAYARALVRRAPAGLDHATFVAAGGAEANEKALRIARLQAPTEGPRDRVLAFKHSFHGRTLAALMATYNPTKRGPFELPGHEAIFADHDLDALEQLLRERGSEIYAAIIEPMMAEGGDVYLDREFLLGVRRLTREHGIPLIADEVQTGFWTGGPFFWWTRLGLGETEDTSPDFITCAKKAGIGAVVSRWPDPEPAPVCQAAALRGLIQLETAADQDYLEDELESRLEELAARFDIVERPRVAGTTFAFDLPDAAARDHFINQRFMRGFMTYGAGARTVRFRLNASFESRHLDDLFARIAEGLTLLGKDEAFEWVAERQRPARSRSFMVRPISRGDWPHVMRIERAAYEPARADSEESLREAAEAGLGLVAVDEETGALLGFCFAAPLEAMADRDGPRQDDHLGREDSVYSVDVTVAPDARGRGVGRALKGAQLVWARKRGFAYVTGRNRVGATDAMAALNRSVGAYPVTRLTGQYEGNGEADYYRIPLRSLHTPRAEPRPLDLASGLQAPFGPNPPYAGAREVVGPTVNKLNLSNWATPDIIQYVEHLRVIAPRGTSHAYFTSSRDETVDKSMRCLRLSRPEARIAIGLEGGYVGHTTAAARSLSDPAGFAERFGLFDFPRIPHPTDGVDATVAALDALVARHGAGSFFGLYAEVVGERSGNVLEGEAAEALAAACRRHDLPLVLVETASGLYRGAQGHAWGVDALPAAVVPDLVLWWPGGQLGHIFTGDRYYIDAPLTLISTWDGDELCVIRTHEALRAARQLEPARAAEAFEELVSGLAARLDATPGGRGLFRTLRMAPQLADRWVACARDRGLQLGRGLPGVVCLVPPLDVSEAHLRYELGPALEQCAELALEAD